MHKHSITNAVQFQLAFAVDFILAQRLALGVWVIKLVCVGSGLICGPSMVRSVQSGSFQIVSTLPVTIVMRSIAWIGRRSIK